jgi:hypothetical protein
MTVDVQVWAMSIKALVPLIKQEGGTIMSALRPTPFVAFLSPMPFHRRSIAVRRVAFAVNGDRADLYIRTSLKRSPSGIMTIRRPILIMRVEKVPLLRRPICIFSASVAVVWNSHVIIADFLTCGQGAPKLIKKKFQPREMGIDANTVAGALHPLISACRVRLTPHSV